MDYLYPIVTGFLIDFIAAPVVAGFASAAAFTIATTQIESLLGLKFDAEGFLNIRGLRYSNTSKRRKNGTQC